MPPPQVDILHNEANAKDKALAKEKQAHAVAAVQRDGERQRPRRACPLPPSPRSNHSRPRPSPQRCGRRPTSAPSHIGTSKAVWRRRSTPSTS